MHQANVVALSRQLLVTAATHHSRRAGETVYGAHQTTLHQTVIALVGGAGLAEHESPGEATLQGLTGRVRLVAGDRSEEGVAGDLLVIPPARHSLEALEDSVVLLTVARG